jgi:hypothetical protein
VFINYFFIIGVQNTIMEEMGKMYVEFPSFDLKASYDDSSN